MSSFGMSTLVLFVQSLPGKLVPQENFSPTDLHLQDNVYFISVIQPDLEYRLCLLSCRVCQNSIGTTYTVRGEKLSAVLLVVDTKTRLTRQLNAST